MTPRLTTGRLLLVVYLVLLAVSQGVRAFSDHRAHRPPGAHLAVLRTVDGDALGRRDVRVAWREIRPDRPRTTLLLVHGSPGSGRDFDRLAAVLGDRYRLVIPDLPGFGASDRDLPDLSCRAEARYLDQLLEQAGVDRVHVVGFSLGGATAVELQDLDPERVASVTLLAATGVQELELLGDYHLNHLVHALQLGAIRLATELLPHMGWLDDALLDVAYARSFYDTDQRPIRAILERYRGPMLILHGRDDPLVPVAAAREHARIVPQSELVLLDSDHFMVFRPGEAGSVAERIAGFVDGVDADRALTRDRADPDRAAAARAPFDPAGVPRATGLTLVVVMLLVAAATLVSEDLTCVSVGWLIAGGRLGFLAGTTACLVGIFAGDLMLFLAGRWLGGAVLRVAPMRWMVDPERLERSRRWLERRGPAVILLSRFLPGTRLATYVATGAAGVRLRVFVGWFLLAAAVWTPLLVGLAAIVGHPVRRYLQGAAQGVAGLLLVALAALALVRLGVPMVSHRGRRRLLGLWRRWTRWEFWPLWLFYVPVVVYLVWLALRFRHPTIFTAANPGMPHGGVIGESKSAILDLFREDGGILARYRLLPPGDPPVRLERLRRFLGEHALDYPVVLKPDVGQRGLDVRVVRSEPDARRYLERHPGPTLVQEHVAGREFGVFYVRLPDESRGRVFSVTDKRLPEVIGDGRRTLEQLIRDDDRAVAIAAVYIDANAGRLDTVPAAGDRVRLVELGTHCRGAIFLDGRRLITPELERAVDALSRKAAGFHFGRYDVIAPSETDLAAGRGLRVIELNGVTSEATHIYDPSLSLAQAYRTLFRQWWLAFEAGRQNRLRGHRPTGLLALLGEARRFARRRRGAAAPDPKAA